MDHEIPRRGSPQLAVVNEQYQPDHSIADTSRPQEDGPAAGLAGAAARNAEKALPGTGAPLKVCVVEDSYSTLRAIFKVLNERGDEVNHFSQLEDAFAALRGGSYQILVVSDSIMGGAAASDALITWVRQSNDRTLESLPILALTDVDSAARCGTLRAVGASTVLAGFSEHRFQNALLALLGQTSASAETTPLRRVCLLEDSYSLSLSLSAALSQAGHEVEHFVQSSEALAALRNRRYDLLIAGQNDGRADLPCGSLVERARALAHAANAALPVLVLTNDASPANIQALRRAGADRILTKNADNLEQHVLNFVERGVAPAERQPPKRRKRPGRAASPPPSSIPTLDVAVSVPAASAGPAETQAPTMAAVAKAPSSPPPISSAQFTALEDAPPPRVERPVARSAPASPQTWFRPWWGIAALVTVGGLLLWQLFLDRTPVEVVSAKLGTVSRTLGGTGYVVSKRQVDLPPPQAGQLYRVYGSEGNLVRKGEPLATLDNREAIINVRRAEAQVFRFRSEVDLADKTLKEWSSQKNQEVSKLVMRDLQTSRTVAAGKLRIAEQELKAAELAVEKLAIQAPFAGMVTQSFAVEGKWVEPRVPLFTLADLDSWEVAVRVKGAEAADIAAGQIVRLSTEGAASEEWLEKVLRVAGGNGPGQEGNNSRGDAVVYVSLGDEAPALEFGERVLAEIVTESVNKTVKVPYETVVERDGKTYVAAVEDARVAYRPVEVGVRSLADVEIVKGLTAGEQVILPRAPLDEGQRVVVTAVAEGIEPGGENYPYRGAFPDVNVLSTAQLREKYDDVLIIDVRSKFEFDVIHIASAVNVPLSEEEFLANLERVRAKDASQPLVFYCNGHSCSKSYEAVRKAASGGFQNLFAYDGGISQWMGEQSERTTLLGETPVPLRRLISEDYFQGRLITLDAFRRKAQAENTVVIDVRDAIQQGTAMSMPAVHVPLDEFMAKIDSGEYQGKQLLIFDAVGKQVRWLQYILEDRGHKEYFFLRDGIATLND